MGVYRLILFNKISLCQLHSYLNFLMALVENQSVESEGLRFDSARGLLLSLSPTLVTRRKTSFPEVNLDTFNFFLS